MFDREYQDLQIIRIFFFFDKLSNALFAPGPFRSFVKIKRLDFDERDAGSCCWSGGGKSKIMVKPLWRSCLDSMVSERCYAKILNFKMPSFCPALENSNL